MLTILARLDGMNSSSAFEQGGSMLRIVLPCGFPFIYDSVQLPPHTDVLRACWEISHRMIIPDQNSVRVRFKKKKKKCAKPREDWVQGPLQAQMATGCWCHPSHEVEFTLCLGICTH